MDFSRLPDTAFLKIFEYLPMEDCIRAGRVNKTFRRIAQLVTSRTKSLDLREDRFRKLTSAQLAVILHLCSANLEWIKFPSRNDMMHPIVHPLDVEDWNQRAIDLDNHGEELATIFSNYECHRLINIDLGCIRIDQVIFEQLIRNNPKMESLIWSRFAVFPEVTNNNLKKLDVHVPNAAAIQSLVGRCPNLKELKLVTGYDNNINANIWNQFFDSIPQVNRICLDINEDMPMNYIEFERDLVGFWNLPLTSLSIDFPDVQFPGDSFLLKLASSFPNLQKLQLVTMSPTNAGIAALAELEELEIVELNMFDYGQQQFDQGIRQLAYCKKLQKLDVDASNVTGGTLVNILRSCPQLERVAVWEITEVANPEEAAVILGSLTGIRKRDIIIEFGSSNAVVKSIWDTEPVKDMMGKLEENDGLKIKIIWSSDGYNSDSEELMEDG